MAQVNGRLLALYGHEENLVNSSSLKPANKDICLRLLKNSGEQSRAILALLFFYSD